MNNKNEYLGVPLIEHIVPFPNFGSVLFQHAREFPGKTALKFEDTVYSYRSLLELCMSAVLPDSDIHVALKDLGNELPVLLACLVQGKPFALDFNKPASITLTDLEHKDTRIEYFEPPYVRLDDRAMILNGEYIFSQYNILVAAQAVGKAFNLFREGAAYCPPAITSITDLAFGILGPLYFAKSIHFSFNNDPDVYQYAWNKVIDSSLRDHSMVFFKTPPIAEAYSLETSFDEAMGLGTILSPDGKIVPLLGFETGEDGIKGHCLGDRIK